MAHDPEKYVAIVDNAGEADMMVAIVGDQVLDLGNEPTLGDAIVWNGTMWVPSPPVPAPFAVNKTDGNMSLVGSTGAPWTDVDPSGSAAARNLDLVFPNVVAEQWLTVAPCFGVTAATGGLSQDMAVIKAAASVRRISNAAFGIPAWFVAASVAQNIAANFSFQVQEADIENGSVRLRHQFSLANTFTRTISAASGLIYRMEGRGPFG